MSTSAADNLHEARFWKTEGERAACHLCPHALQDLAERQGGLLRGPAESSDGKLYSLIYGRRPRSNVDPIEKKPLFHFNPGQPILSSGQHRLQSEMPALARTSPSPRRRPKELRPLPPDAGGGIAHGLGQLLPGRGLHLQRADHLA